MNKCSLNEYDNFKMYFQASITNNEKWAISILIFALKTLPHIFPRHHFYPVKVCVCVCVCVGGGGGGGGDGGARGSYLAHGL